MIKKSFILLGIIGLGLFMGLVTVQVQAQPYYQSETINLLQTGSLASPVILNLTKTYSHLTSLSFYMDVADDAIDFSGFGANNTALDNGIFIDNIDGQAVIPGNITTNGELFKGATSHDFDIDTNTPKGNLFTSYFNLRDISEPGLIINATSVFHVYIQDDLVGNAHTITELTLTVAGYQGSQDPQTIVFSGAQPVYITTTSFIATMGNGGFGGILSTQQAVNLINNLYFWFLIGFLFLFLVIRKRKEKRSK